MTLAGALLSVELSTMTTSGGLQGALVMITLAEDSSSNGVTSFLAWATTLNTPKVLSKKIGSFRFSQFELQEKVSWSY